MRAAIAPAAPALTAGTAAADRPRFSARDRGTVLEQTVKGGGERNTLVSLSHR